MTKCMSCGFDQNRSDAKYCLNCGARLAFLVPSDVLKERYKIVSVLGKGGMGAVCLAEDLQTFGNRCVVKEMTYYFDPTDPDEVAKAQKRFEDEARTLAQLNHPAIPDVRDYFSEAGRNYLVMEYIEGENLEERLTRESKPLPLAEVVQYGIRVCRVLEYLGAQNPPLVHHDIKPANIIVSKEADSTSLVDFGTAKMHFVQTGGQLGQSQSSVYGTLGYAPPEQYGDQPKTEPRSDVYALGATMYRLLTNDDPSDHPMQFPLLSTLPANIRQVLERALENDVEKRITAREMREALEKVLVSEGMGQAPVSPPVVAAPDAEKRAGGWLRFFVSLVFVTIMGALLSWIGSGLVGQAAVYGLDDELTVPLAGLGILLVLVTSLMIGSSLGGPTGFSKLGFLFGLVLSVPASGYLFLIMLAQFCGLRTVGGEPLAYIGVAAVGVFLFLLLGSFRGLRKARRNVLAFVIPLLLIIAPTWWGANDPRVWLETTTYWWPGKELPSPRLELDNRQPGVYIEWGRDLVVPYVAVSGRWATNFATMAEAAASELSPVVPHVWRDLLYPASQPRQPSTASASGLSTRRHECPCPCLFQ